MIRSFLSLRNLFYEGERLYLRIVKEVLKEWNVEFDRAAKVECIPHFDESPAHFSITYITRNMWIEIKIYEDLYIVILNIGSTEILELSLYNVYKAILNSGIIQYQEEQYLHDAYVNAQVDWEKEQLSLTEMQQFNKWYLMSQSKTKKSWEKFKTQQKQ